MNVATAVKHDIANAALAAEGKKKIEWAERNMPVLAQIRERFEKEQPFKGIRISACMHVTTETANLMRALKAGGAELALCASNPLSTQDDTAAALVHEYGISVFARNAVDRDGYYSHINASLDIQPHLVFDDGCDLVNTLHTTRTELIDGIIGGCEETTTGVIRLSQMTKDGALKFPMIAVNDTDTKHMFDNRFGTGQSTLDAIFRSTNSLVAGKTFVVAGFGYCGKGVAERAKGMGADVIITEIDPTKALDALMQGYRVMPMTEAAKYGDIYVTVTGNRDVLREEHFKIMKDGAILSNAGHFDIEIDVAWLNTNFGHTKDTIKPQVDLYNVDGNDIILLAEGRLVNLGCGTGHPSFVMSASFTNQVLAQIELWTNNAQYDKNVFVLPKHLDEKVARLHLGKIGVVLDELTTEQADYLGIAKSGPFKGENYRY